MSTTDINFDRESFLTDHATKMAEARETLKGLQNLSAEDIALNRKQAIWYLEHETELSKCDADLVAVEANKVCAIGLIAHRVMGLPLKKIQENDILAYEMTETGLAIDEQTTEEIYTANDKSTRNNWKSIAKGLRKLWEIES